ncbi:hypothetical protein BSK59_22435 [Paenibacillus odorifer]|nr:hypothetical protein BSK59_22435 [Paenibacillus odorifer]
MSEWDMYEYVFYDKFLISTSEDNKHTSISPKVMSDSTMIPKMTSNTAPSGIVKASSYSGSYVPYYAFNGIYNDNITTWMTTYANLPAWISYSFDSQIEVTNYAMLPRSTASRMPKNWTFEGSNDDVNWTILDRQTNFTSWVAYVKSEFKVPNPNKYKSYRIYIENLNGDTSYLEIYGIEMYGVREYAKLIQIDSPTEMEYVNHGMESIAISLSEEISRRSFISKNSSILGSGKVFRQSINTSKNPIKKVFIT